MDNTPNEFCHWAEIYALGGLDEEEKLEFEKHLAECADCQAQLKELAPIIDVLPFAAFEIAPPEGMKSRVLGRVLNVDGTTAGTASGTIDDEEDKAEISGSVIPERIITSSDSPYISETAAKRSYIPRKRNNRLRNLCIALATAAAVLIMYTAVLNQDVRGLRKELAESEQTSEGLKQQLARVDSPSRELKVNEAVVLDPVTEDIVARGLATIVIDAKGTHLLVQAEKLPELSGSEAFQVWLIKGDVKQNAGTFLTSQGTGAMYFTFDPQEYDTVAITLEPDGQGEQPRGRVILAAELEG